LRIVPHAHPPSNTVFAREASSNILLAIAVTGPNDCDLSLASRCVGFAPGRRLSSFAISNRDRLTYPSLVDGWEDCNHGKESKEGEGKEDAGTLGRGAWL
jgi:hypothetical protein